MAFFLNLISFVGIFALCGIAWLGSEHKNIIHWKIIVVGIGVQLGIGLLIFTLPITQSFIVFINDFLNAFIAAAEQGSRFIFGDVIVPQVNTSPQIGVAAQWLVNTLGSPFVAVSNTKLAPENLNLGYVFAFRALPLVIFFSALVSLLYRLGILPFIINQFARFFRWAMGISGAEALSGAANIFVGIESAIAVKPFLTDMTRSELCAILTACFGSIASTVLGIYAGFLLPVFPNITGHLMSASVLTIPACFVISKILVPETGQPVTMGGVPKDKSDTNTAKPTIMESIILGALDGVKLAVGIAAVLIAVVGLMKLLDSSFAGLAGLSDSNHILLAIVGDIFQFISLQNIFGVLFLPLTFLTGVSLDWSELWTASVLIGQRVYQTSIPSYLSLAGIAQDGLISDRALLIISYVLCGFAHIPSYGIFVGGLANLAPLRRSEISVLGWRALWGATLATLMTGCIAGLFYFEGMSMSILGK